MVVPISWATPYVVSVASQAGLNLFLYSPALCPIVVYFSPRNVKYMPPLFRTAVDP